MVQQRTENRSGGKAGRRPVLKPDYYGHLNGVYIGFYKGQAIIQVIPINKRLED